VIGCGGLGQFAIQYLKLLTEARVIAVDPVAAKQKRALELGADEAVSREELDEQANVVLDFVGSNETLAQASTLVQTKGIVIQLGEARGSLQFALGRVPHEAVFTTSIWGSLADMQPSSNSRRGESFGGTSSRCRSSKPIKRLTAFGAVMSSGESYWCPDSLSTSTPAFATPAIRNRAQSLPTTERAGAWRHAPSVLRTTAASL
jgi:Zinc-binding dehydrogenase